jgi:hypothetical protein
MKNHIPDYPWVSTEELRKKGCTVVEEENFRYWSDKDSFSLEHFVKAEALGTVLVTEQFTIPIIHTVNFSRHLALFMARALLTNLPPKDPDTINEILDRIKILDPNNDLTKPPTPKPE